MLQSAQKLEVLEWAAERAWTRSWATQTATDLAALAVSGQFGFQSMNYFHAVSLCMLQNTHIFCYVYGNSLLFYIHTALHSMTHFLF